ncbi:unnamed protein product [Urochloa decumbens]|uniref:DUF1618 domain-containing protein n=1 Tax=Urochloa decumbens TaxID=240449 RepID=A0ABC9AK81_9POAL
MDEDNPAAASLLNKAALSAPSAAALAVSRSESEMSPPPPPSSSCGWAILGAIPRVSAAADEECCSLDLAPPPRVSILTIPKHVFPAVVTPRNYPRLLAADASSLLLLHADQGRATSPTVIDQSFCWREFPDPIMNAGHVGIIASPDAPPGSYMVAELHATLLCFSSDKVLALGGLLWWVDLSWCTVARDPDLAVVPLPPAKALPYAHAAGVLHRYRDVGISAGKLRFVDMYRNRHPDPSGRCPRRNQPHPTSAGSTPPTRPRGSQARSPSSRSSTPTIPPSSTSSSTATSSPSTSATAVVACDLYHLVDPPKDLVSTRFVHAWKLPPPKPLLLSPPSPAPAGMAKEGTNSGPNDVGATASVDIY